MKSQRNNQIALGKERIPEDWNSSLIFPIHMKDEPQNCRNYKDIALLNFAYKMLA